MGRVSYLSVRLSFFFSGTFLSFASFATDGIEVLTKPKGVLLHNPAAQAPGGTPKEDTVKAHDNAFCSTIPPEVIADLEKRWIDPNEYTGLENADVSPRSLNPGNLSRDLHLAMDAAYRVYSNHDYLMGLTGEDDGLFKDILRLTDENIHWAGLTAPPGYETVALWYDDTANPALTTVDYPTKMFAVKYRPKDRDSDLPVIISIKGTSNLEQWKGNLGSAGYSNTLGLARNARSFFRYPQDPSVRQIAEDGLPKRMTGGMFFSEAAQDSAQGREVFYTGHSLGGIATDYLAAVLPAEAGRLYPRYGTREPMPTMSFYSFNSGSTGGPGVKGMNARSGILTDETLSGIDKLRIRDRMDPDYQRYSAFRGVFANIYKRREVASNRQADLRSETVQFGDPDNTELLTAVHPRASSFPAYTQGYNGFGPVTEIPSMNAVRIALNLDPLTRFGNPKLGNYHPGENIVVPVIPETFREIEQNYASKFPSGVLGAAVNPAGTAWSVLKKSIEKAKETAHYHSMDALGVHTDENVLRLGIELYTDLQASLQNLQNSGGSEELKKKILADLDRLAKEKAELQRAYYALYCA